MNPKITQKEINQVVNILSKLEPGYLPQEIFYQFTRLYVTPIIELVPIRKTDTGEIRVLTIEREADDPHWPGLIHTPGTVLRANDESVENALNRIQNKELKGMMFEIKPIFVHYDFHRVNRGMELALVYVTEYSKSIEGSVEVDPANFPENLVDTQINFIQKAIEHHETKNH